MAYAKLPAALAERYGIINQLKTDGDNKIYVGYDFLNKDKVIIARYEKKYLHVSRQGLKSLKGLKHDNLASIRSVNFVYPWVFIIQDYIYGQLLSEIMNQDIKVKQSMTENWCYQLENAIRYLHSQKPYGFVHGDIKPHNVMVDNQNKAKLIDFCCLKEINKRILYANLKATRTYAAEEVLQVGSYDFQSDWYSLKLLQYRLREHIKD